MASENHILRKTVLLLSLIALGAFVGALVSVSLIQPIFHIDISENLQLFTFDTVRPELAPVLKFMQIVQVFFTFIIPAQIFARIQAKGNYTQYFSLGGTKGIHFVMATAIVIVSAPLVAAFAEWNSAITFPEPLQTYLQTQEKTASVATEIMLTANHWYDLLLNLFVVGLLAAFSEELIFRGIIQQMIAQQSKNIHLAIWLSAAVFSFFHFQFFGFLPRFFLGILLGYAFYFSKSLWVPIWMHFLNNAVAIIFYYLYNNGLSNIDPNNNYYFGITGIIASLVICYFVMQVWFKRKEIHGEELG
jgi:hypothetical protein